MSKKPNRRLFRPRQVPGRKARTEPRRKGYLRRHLPAADGLYGGQAE